MPFRKEATMILNQGYVIKRKANTRQIEPYTMQYVNEDGLDQVMRLQNLVYEKLPNKDILYRDSKEDMLADLVSGGKIIGVFNSKEQLIAYRYISFPGNESRNLGHDIHLESSELTKVVHLETTLVDPEYRGNRLQSLTLEKVMEIIEPYQMEHVFCTVSPFNFFSLYNIMSSGLKIEALKQKYGTPGLWRFILHKDLKKESIIDSKSGHSIQMNNIQDQRALIDRGFVGYHLEKESQCIQYARLC